MQEYLEIILNEITQTYLINSLYILLSLLAGFASLKQLRATRSSSYLWITIAFWLNTFEQVLHLSIRTQLISPDSISAIEFLPGTASIGSFLLAAILLVSSIVKSRHISPNTMPSHLGSYLSLGITAILAYTTILFLAPSVIIPLPHLPGNELAVWEYLTATLAVLAIGVVLVKQLKKHKAFSLFLVFSLLALATSEILYSLSYSTDSQYFLWAILAQSIVYIIYLPVILLSDPVREDSTSSSRFSIATQLKLALTTVIGLLAVLTFFLVRSQPFLLEQIQDPTALLQAKETNSYGLGILLIIIVVGMGLLIISIHRITTQFKNINQTIDSIKSGDLSMNMQVYSDDEFGKLASAFEQVTHQLNTSSTVLREKVQERTEDLKSQVKQYEEKTKALTDVKKDLEFAKYEVEQEKARDEAMLDSIGEGIIVVNKDGRIEMLNHKAIQLLEMTEDQLLKQKVADAITMTDKDGTVLTSTKQPITLALTIGEKTMSDKYLFTKSDNTTFPAFITATPIILDGSITGGIQVFRDITKEKEVDQAKSEFVSLASHQLRTPLTTISWYAEALINRRFGELNEKQNEYLEEIYSGNRRMIELVNSLLNVSRIELGAFTIHPQEENLIEFINIIIKELAPLIKDKKLKLDRSYQEKEITMQLDPNLIHIVIHNLMTNAIKYTREGGEIEVKVTKDDTTVTVAVKDNGYGIPEDEKSKIFSKLFRASNVNSEESTGTGLGLYIVQSIMDKAGGNIWFESVENKGTTFYVSLPLYGMKKIDGNRKLIQS